MKLFLDMEGFLKQETFANPKDNINSDDYT